MPSLLCLGDQAFWVSNGVKDLLYEVTVEVARRESPVAHRRLTEDGRLIGCYGVSGMGFDLEAFIDAFGGRDAWRAAAATHWDAIEGLCETPQSLAIMTKVFVWIWFLVDNGRVSEANARHPTLDELPDTPPVCGELTIMRRTEAVGGTDRIAFSTKLVLGMAIGIFVG